ncbi:MAG: helix-turn-helix domain-containing protein [Sphaerochaetaceae bacterium]|jgi:transposase-like protein
MRYSTGFQASVVRKVLQRGDKSVYQVSKETGISSTTIHSWMLRHKAGKLDLDTAGEPTVSQRSPGEKLALLLESKTLGEEDLGEWLRRQGLHSEHLPLWEQELTGMANDKQGEIRNENSALRKENKRLEKELARKEKALAEVAVLLTRKKKHPDLFDQDGGN